MAFNSYGFVLAFMPVFIIGYFLFGKRNPTYAKVFTICASLVFYALNQLSFLWLLIVNTLVNYALGTYIHKTKSKAVMIFGIVLNILELFYYKYLGFFGSIVNSIAGSNITIAATVLPLGISFLTFQMIAYLADMQKEGTAAYSLLDFAEYTTFFPKTVQGPIVLHKDLIPQFNEDERYRLNTAHVNEGLYRFTLGLAKKVILAEFLGSFVDTGFSDVGSITTMEAVFISVSYTLQLYFDFSGYCDMASGVSRMINIDLPENFLSPYKAKDFQDFWRRWHITLSGFFTRYVYIPLGGNRKGIARTLVNIMIIFTLSGLWHGANWTFVFWGIFHGLFSVLYRLTKKVWDRVPSFLRMVVTFALVNCLWVLFRASSLAEAVTFFKRLFSMTFYSSNTELYSMFNGRFLTNMLTHLGLRAFVSNHLSMIYFGILVILILVCFFAKNTKEIQDGFKPSMVRVLITVFLLVICILQFNGVRTFLYVNF